MNVRKELVNYFSRLPNWISLLILFLNRSSKFIYGKKYSEHINFLQRTPFYDNKYALINIVNYSIEHVPYYGNYKKISSLKEFQEFGFIDKNVVANNFALLRSVDLHPRQYDLVTTGGSTGLPLRMLQPKSRYILEMATLHWVWKRVGYDHHARAVLRNHRLNENQIYRINPITKEFLFDGFRVSDDYYQEVYRTIKKYNIQYIHAYPSNAYSFAKFIDNNELDSSFIKAFVSSSENVFDYQRELIERKLNIDFLTFYGHSEKLILAWYCKFCEAYHVESTYGFFELINDNGEVIDEIGRSGQIVGTTLHNFGMPLIRYKTDDYAELAGFRCERENRNVLSIKKIRGRRSGSYIYAGDGTKTTATALNLHDELYLYIDGIQYLQEKKGELQVLIVKGKRFNTSVHYKLRKHYKERLKNTQIVIKYVDTLIKLPNGKFMDLISKVDTL